MWLDINNNEEHITSGLAFKCSDWKSHEKIVGVIVFILGRFELKVWIEFEFCTVIVAEIRFNWDKLNNNLWPGNSSRNCSRMLHIWGAKLFQPNGSLTYVGNHRPQSISISVSLSRYFPSFYPLPPFIHRGEFYCCPHRNIPFSCW